MTKFASELQVLIVEKGTPHASRFNKIEHAVLVPHCIIVNLIAVTQ